MKILIAGGGTLGRELVEALPEHDITLIEVNAQKVKALSQDFGKRKNFKIIEGNASKRYVLKEANLEKQDVFIAVTHDDQVNLFLSLIAKKSGRKAVSRVKEPEFIPLFQELGVDAIISPEKQAAMDIASKITWE
ncbi:MAG TPA: hypothetical protein ENN13_02760 [Candidatus Altiarchaeales archaeon]|nr:hypothetical protein [Candidatus Altiarchaeales archaeon]